VPIVFTVVADPVGAGYVQSLAHPGGNATGFTGFEYAFAGKWLELLKEIAPSVTRVAVLREAGSVTGPAQFGAIQAVAPTLGVELRPVDTRDVNEIDHAITAFARNSNGGMIGGARGNSRPYREGYFCCTCSRPQLARSVSTDSSRLRLLSSAQRTRRFSITKRSRIRRMAA
jgi:putative ABC transport system substrate-binding protein